MELIVTLLVLALIALAGGGTVWLCALAFRRRNQLPKAVTVLTWVVIAVCLAGGLGTALGILKAFGAVGGESVDPSQKARILAEGISEAMSWTALGLLAWLPCVLVLAISLFWKRDSKR